jgi:dolichol kinase
MPKRTKMQEMKSVLLNDSMKEKEMRDQLNIFMLIWYKRSIGIFETHFWIILLKFTLFFLVKKTKATITKKLAIWQKLAKKSSRYIQKN